MATLLMAWAKHRLRRGPGANGAAITFGSPPVLAADRWAIRRDALVAGADARAERVARARARGDWVGELAAAVGWGASRCRSWGNHARAPAEAEGRRGAATRRSLPSAATSERPSPPRRTPPHPPSGIRRRLGGLDRRWS